MMSLLTIVMILNCIGCATASVTFKSSQKPPLVNQQPRNWWSYITTLPGKESHYCVDPKDNPELLSYNGNGSVTCVSTKPIIIYALLSPRENFSDFSALNYSVTMERELCHRQSEGQPHSMRFKGAIKINQTVLTPPPQRIYVYCNTAEQTKRFDFFTKDIGQENGDGVWVLGHIQNATNNSAPQPQPIGNCSSESFLASDASRSKFICIDNGEPKPVEFLQCSPWNTCDAYARTKYENMCTGFYNETYCERNPTKCLNGSSPTNNGMVICKTSNDSVFLMPIFAYTFNGSKNASWHLVHEFSNLEGFVKINRVEVKSENFTKQSIFNCTAPEFLGMKSFNWSVTRFDTGSKKEVSRKCVRNINITSDRRFENCVYIYPSESPKTKANMTCTVYFYNRKLYADTFINFTILSQVDGHKYILIGLGSASLILLLALIWYHFKVKRQKRKLFSSEQIRHFLEGSIKLNNLKQANNEQGAMVVPYDKNLEIPRKRITLEPVILGRGNFGKVVKGLVGKRQVAVKTIDMRIDGKYFLALLAELKILTYVGTHENIVELVGANTEKIKQHDVLIIYEFCDNGNIRDYILARRENFVDLIVEAKTGQPYPDNSIVEYENCVSTQKLSSLDLLQWSVEIAAGMEFIASKNVCHGDLAARNILLSSNLVAKIGDFGLAKHLMDYSLYVQKNDCPLPLKWMSIESLRDLEFSVQSDVWSYGITIWELFSLGGTPYPGEQWNFQAWKILTEGVRMERAPHASEEIHDILLKCWATLPRDRPAFTDIKFMFGHELENMKRRRHVFS